MNNYIKIIGELNPPKFMNQLANTIKNKFEDYCLIEPNKKALKFNVTFYPREEEEEDETNEEYKKIEEELDKLGIEKINNSEEQIEEKDSIIQV